MKTSAPTVDCTKNGICLGSGARSAAPRGLSLIYLPLPNHLSTLSETHITCLDMLYLSKLFLIGYIS